MPTTLPQYTKTIDNAFLQTWYEIRAEAIDNILDAIVMWAALKSKGCMKTQVGGTNITRTVKYGTSESLVQAVAKGDTLGMGEVETETMATFYWRYLTIPIQRSTIDDQQNAGKFRIKSYISQRMEEAREALQQQYEGDLFRAGDTTESAHKYIQSLNDIVPTYATRATGTYGSIARSNTWWQCKYKQFTGPKETNLVSDMRNMFNTVGANKSYPDLIVCTQSDYELYEEFGLDSAQIVKSGSGPLVDLGFQTMKFKGADMIWTADQTTDMLFLNSKFIEFVYDPNFWFQMSEWKPSALQFERIAHILSVGNTITPQPRRHGRLYV